jgi:hypothetical protein
MEMFLSSMSEWVSEFLEGNPVVGLRSTALSKSLFWITIITRSGRWLNSPHFIPSQKKGTSPQTEKDKIETGTSSSVVPVIHHIQVNNSQPSNYESLSLQYRNNNSDDNSINNIT